MGHEIPSGASYCAQGHPIALEQMQFAPAPDQYGGQGGFGAPPQPAFGPAPVQDGSQGVYGAPPPQGFGPPPVQGGFAAPPPAPAFPSPGQQGFGAPPPPYGAPPGPAPGAAPSLDAGGAVPGNIVRGFLVAYGVNPAGDFWPLKGGRIAIGRQGGEGIDITLHDPTISSRHAALMIDAVSGGVSVEDTGSTNGTFVNDEHIGFNGRRDLRDGDRLRFGGFTTIVKVIGRV